MLYGRESSVNKDDKELTCKKFLSSIKERYKGIFLIFSSHMSFFTSRYNGQSGLGEQLSLRITLMLN